MLEEEEEEEEEEDVEESNSAYPDIHKSFPCRFDLHAIVRLVELRASPYSAPPCLTGA